MKASQTLTDQKRNTHEANESNAFVIAAGFWRITCQSSK